MCALEFKLLFSSANKALPKGTEEVTSMSWIANSLINLKKHPVYSLVSEFYFEIHPAADFDLKTLFSTQIYKEHIELIGTCS